MFSFFKNRRKKVFGVKTPSKSESSTSTGIFNNFGLLYDSTPTYSTTDPTYTPITYTSNYNDYVPSESYSGYSGGESGGGGSSGSWDSGSSCSSDSSSSSSCD